MKDFDDIIYGLYEIPIIKQAFDLTFVSKVKSDGYVDLSMFIYGRILKQEMLKILTEKKSKYALLYKKSFPKFNNILRVWRDIFDSDKEMNDCSKDTLDFLSTDEADAIVNWTFRSLKNVTEREMFTRKIVKNTKEFIGISYEIALFKGVVYNKKNIDLHIVSSFDGLNKFLSVLKRDEKKLYFYRGHSNSNYRLLPSIMRTPIMRKNESILYKELLINCPKEFNSYYNHLEKLVKMQHYGLPTRLLDITRNILVALYFACESNFSAYGELVLLEEDREKIKYPNSDTISILASLPLFSYDVLKEYYSFAINKTMSEKIFNDKISRLISEIRMEKPAFKSEVKKTDILDSYVVYAEMNNDRIIKQDGAFILCGLDNRDGFLEKFRYKNGSKKVVILIKNKKRFLAQLENYSINRATLFPEIDFVSEYLKSKYSK